MNVGFFRTSGGWAAKECYRPSVVEFARDVKKDRAQNANSSTVWALPFGRRYAIYKAQLAYEPGHAE